MQWTPYTANVDEMKGLRLWEPILEGLWTDPIDTPSLIWREEKSMKEWVPLDEELPSYVLSGRLKHIPPPKNKVVKIFLSSTFTGAYLYYIYTYGM